MLRLSEEIKVKDINNRYVILCRNVMRLIKRKHETVLCNPTSNSELDMIYERNYMLTFAYLMGQKSVELRSIDKLLSQKLVNGEVNKYIFLNSDDKAYESRNKLKPGRDYFCPDFLIHSSHEKSGGNYEGQYMILEAKTTSKLKQEDFDWDLFKLNLYVEKLNFDTAIFLIVNTSYTAISTMVSNYKYWHSEKLDPTKSVDHNNVIPHIYFLIQGKVTEQPRIYKLII